MSYLKGDLVFITDRCGYRFKTSFGRVVGTTKSGSLRIERLEEDLISDDFCSTQGTTKYKLKLDENGNPIRTLYDGCYISRKGSDPKKGDSSVDGSFTVEQIKDKVFSYTVYY